MFDFLFKMFFAVCLVERKVVQDLTVVLENDCQCSDNLSAVFASDCRDTLLVSLRVASG